MLKHNINLMALEINQNPKSMHFEMLLSDVSLIISIVGTLLSIAGLIMTIKTFINTKNIAKRLKAEKIKEVYPQYHKAFVDCLGITLTALQEGGREYNIILSLYKNSRFIHSFIDNLESNQKKDFDNFLGMLDKFSPGKTLSDDEAMELVKSIIDMQSTLERIGKLNGI